MHQLNEAQPSKELPVVFVTNEGLRYLGKFDGHYFVTSRGEVFTESQVKEWSLG